MENVLRYSERNSTNEDTDEPPRYFEHTPLPPLLEARYEQTTTRLGLAGPAPPALVLAHHSANHGAQNVKRPPPTTPQRKRRSRSASISPQPWSRTLPALTHTSLDTGGQPGAEPKTTSNLGRSDSTTADPGRFARFAKLGAERQTRKTGTFAKIRRMVLGAQQPTAPARSPKASPNRTTRKLRANWADPEPKGQEAALSVRLRFNHREELR
jgi:hypothetical protein